MNRGERKLLRKAAKGDEKALERLYEDHVDALYAFAFYRVGRDESLAEDAVQETFTRALADPGGFDPARGSLRGWLVTLSRNAVRDQLRAHRRLTAVEQWERIDEILAQVFTALDREPLSDEIIAREETRDMVNMTIANLPDHYSDVLSRKYVAGETLTDLSARLGLSEDAAKSLLARARRAFRETFAALTDSMSPVAVEGGRVEAVEGMKE